MRFVYYKFLTTALAAVLLLSCCEEKPITPPGPVPAERVFLMYDNIGSWFNGDVMEAGEAVAEGALGDDERVVVFHRNYRLEDQTGSRSVIYELVKDTKQEDGYRKEMLKVYASGVNAALSAEVMAAVVGDIRTTIPADHYGFAFGSHGMGWVPASNTVTITRKGSSGASEHPFADLWAERENPMTRYLLGYGQKLDISEFADALDKWSWDFILLDDCFMASVEALYEMRDLADYIIASPTEIMDTGFPYDRVVKTIFADWSEAGFKQMGAEYVDYYKNNSRAPYGTIAVVKTSELSALAETVRRLNLNPNELSSVEGIQYYEGFARPGHVFYDLDNYLNAIRASAMPTEYNAFKAQLGGKAVVFKGNTDEFFSQFRGGSSNSGGQTITVSHFSGLAVFIPWNQTSALFPAYQQTEWYKAVYAE